MRTDVIAILGTLGGALVVGLINYFSNRSVKNLEWRLTLARERTAGRQKLYAEFLVEAQHFVALNRANKITSLAEQDGLNGKLAEVCLIAPAGVIEEAKKLVQYAITSSAQQPAKEVADFDELKKNFIVAARDDMALILNEP